mgnify:CR=1 FL=1
MIRKRLILFGFVLVLVFSTLPGCGCGAVQTSVPSETVSVEESSSSSETVTHEEIPSATETEAVETESEAAGDVTVTEETASPEEIEIIEMDAIMYATTAVNVRQEASAGSEKIGSLSKGTAVHVTGITEDEQWYQISDYEDIEVGYISGAYLASEKPSTSSSSGSTSSSESSSSTSTESESATTSESTSTPAETTQPEPETPAETTPAPETPSTSTGGSTTTAPNPGAQEVYDRVQSGQSSGDTNASRFANIQDGSGLLEEGTGNLDVLGSFHAAP